MKRWLFEFDTGNRFGPCSEEHWKEFQKSLERGSPFFLYPYHGYALKMVASEVPDAVLGIQAEVRDVPKEKAPG